MHTQPRRPNSLRPERRGFKGVRRSTPLLDEMTRRTERLGEEFREEIARMIGSQLKDPRIGFVTVTRVEVGTDLRNARIYVGVLGSEADREKTLTGLRQAAGFMRRSLGQKLRLRHTPELTFTYDEGLEAHDRIARLLSEVRTADAAAAGRDDGDAEKE